MLLEQNISLDLISRTNRMILPIPHSFSLSLCGPSSISRANAHMVHMDRNLALYVTLHSLQLTLFRI